MTEQLKSGAFRVFDTEAKEYKDPDEYWMNGRGVLKILYYGDVEPDVPGAADAGPRWIAERWTGFYDDGGKPIYEFDRCRTNGREGIVKQDKDSVSFRVCGCLLYNASRTNIEVIGTIHDSPEALAAAAKAVSQ